MENNYSRRSFIEFLGKGSAGVIISSQFIVGCGRKNQSAIREIEAFIQGIAASDADDVILADGLHYDVLLQWGDLINKRDRFGFNNDFIAYLPSEQSIHDGLLWVNHEDVNTRFVSAGKEPSKKRADNELYNVGGSFVSIQYGRDKKWSVIKDNKANRRISGLTKIPFNWDEKIAKSSTAMGTLANCSGGVTPWGTILTCEENFDKFYGERLHNEKEIIHPSWSYGIHEYYKNPPEHYGWVVEVDPKTGEAQKHVALGRCSHECATMVELKDGRVVVYTGDDSDDECLYKFIFQ